MHTHTHNPIPIDYYLRPYPPTTLASPLLPSGELRLVRVHNSQHSFPAKKRLHVYTPTIVLASLNGRLSVRLCHNISPLTPWCRVLLDWFAASQEIPRVLWNPKVPHRTHKRPPIVPILCQPNPVHIPTSHLLEIHPNIIHISTPMSPQWSLSLRFSHQDPIRPPLLTHTRHMPNGKY